MKSLIEDGEASVHNLYQSENPIIVFNGYFSDTVEIAVMEEFIANNDEYKANGWVFDDVSIDDDCMVYTDKLYHPIKPLLNLFLSKLSLYLHS